MAVALAAAACSSSSTPRHPVTEHVAGNRFTVLYSVKALQEADSVGVNLPRLVTRALGHINALLPGPPVSVNVYYVTGPDLITQQGTGGDSDVAVHSAEVFFGPTSQVSLRTGLTYLPRALSHEVDHSVRGAALPGGYRDSLFQQMISEGISSVFDEAAFPGSPNPMDRAISPGQECVLWRKAQPLLSDAQLYYQWVLGGGSVPHWTGFTIGYDIVKDYLRRHPHTSWVTLTSTRSETILAGSHYRPCAP